MATTAQLRAALAVLHTASCSAGRSVPGRRNGAIDPSTDHVLIAGTLYGILGAELQRTLASAPDDDHATRRWAAATADALTQPPAVIADHANFDIAWFEHRIDALLGYARPPDTGRELLTAVARATDAIKILLYLYSKPGHIDSHPLWRAVLDDLSRAHHLALAATASSTEITTPTARIAHAPAQTATPHHPPAP
ncbi:hypothetical protein [Nocardia thraciensis]